MPSAETLNATANRFYKFQLDSNTTKGQLLCNPLDTIASIANPNVTPTDTTVYTVVVTDITTGCTATT